MGELSLEISNEKISRIIEDSKIKALNIKESALRINNDNKLNEIISENYNNLMKEINKIKQVISNMKKEDERNKEKAKLEKAEEKMEILNDNDGTTLIKMKKEELTELEEDLKYLMNLLSIAINERNKMEKSKNYEAIDLMKINNDIEFLNRKVEVSKNDINSKSEDIKSINH